MGNIFSYFFEKKEKFDDSLMKPLNEEFEYASIIDFNNINSQVSILEQTTQSSLINISKDVKYLFNQVETLKKEFSELKYLFHQVETIKKEFTELKENNTIIHPNNHESVYYEPRDNFSNIINDNETNHNEDTYNE